MKAEEITVLINIAFSITELILRIQESKPDLSQDQTEKLADLILNLRELENKPDSYLENWDGDR